MVALPESSLDNWLPKLVLCLRKYNARLFISDLIAGLTVGLVALPLAMAFGIASGVTPQAGIYTAVVAGFLISAFGGSRVQIGGPTGAFVVIVAGIVARYGVDGLFMCTMMAGGILIALGVTGMGSAIRFIPRPVVVGFTNGIAVLIASTQIRSSIPSACRGVCLERSWRSWPAPLRPGRAGWMSKRSARDSAEFLPVFRASICRGSAPS